MSRRLVVEADGGSRGNPGPAGFGAVVRDADTGEVLAEIAESIGRATNNVAEYQGLIAGLGAAADVDPEALVEARLDSKLVVEQMSGRWRIKHPDMRPLARKAHDIAAGLGKVSYVWVPRAENTHADELANRAMDAAAQGRPISSASHEPASAAPARAAPQPAPPDTQPTRVLLLRHGQTPLSIQRRFSGSGDVALTEVGTEQARAAARRVAARAGDPVQVVVCSPLRRARDTAAVVAEALSVPVEIEEDLREADFGQWEGLTFAEVQQRWPGQLDQWLSDPSSAPVDGESFAAVERRVEAARQRILSRHAGATILIVSHVTPIKSLLRNAMLAPAEALYRMQLDLACLSEIHYFSDGPMVVHSLNDTAHLE
ncbi:bifunctional RNase H/acid phosphatase [Salinactinospora qingdaonensis]|uniref:Bifunctional RNase H/acid phosphatase n=1 Tax=Salinactinospora qingdaonensis TaxID=702744 RepID=A0ABP7EYB9_9ACTN